jgi:pantoate--beta-alanine ligase
MSGSEARIVRGAMEKRMQEIADARTLRVEMLKARCSGKSIGLVPTMGYLHAGHVRLVSEARAANDVVVVSIFVNPTQFGPSEDLDRYPRDLERDRAIAREADVDVLFVPDVDTMYPDGPGNQEIWVEPGKLAAHVDGASRPQHFRGVATVVAKLFNLVQPHRAYFGQKDGQQAFIVDRMTRDLAYDTSVVIVPTVREVDGLAVSSRNVYLSSEERRQAPALSHALAIARAMILDGQRESGLIEDAMKRAIEAEAPLARIEFIAVADAGMLAPFSRVDRDAVIVLAVFFGATRLIDNIVVRFVDGAARFT